MDNQTAEISSAVIKHLNDCGTALKDNRLVGKGFNLLISEIIGAEGKVVTRFFRRKVEVLGHNEARHPAPRIYMPIKTANE